MINSIPINHPHPQPQRISGSCPTDCKLEDERMEVDNGTETQSHTKTVQALRKYLQRKLSSEDSSSERESQSPHQQETTDVFHQSFESTEESKSTLTCSIVYSTANSTGRSNFPLQKQRSLDDYSAHSVHHNKTALLPSPSPAVAVAAAAAGAQTIIPDHRYLRTDLCVPILLSRCTFCDRSFELDDQLREHMREKHWNYFFDNPTHPLSQAQLQEAQEACEALDLSMSRKSPEVTGSLPNLAAMQSFPSSGSLFFGDSAGRGAGVKKLVKCATCGKSFSTKWNWKQHQKIHLRENLQACLQ